MTNEDMVARLSDMRNEPPEDIKPLGHCAYCGSPIFEEDNIYEIAGDYICKNCLEAEYGHKAAPWMFHIEENVKEWRK